MGTNISGDETALSSVTRRIFIFCSTILGDVARRNKKQKGFSGQYLRWRDGSYINLWILERSIQTEKPQCLVDSGSKGLSVILWNICLVSTTKTIYGDFPILHHNTYHIGPYILQYVLYQEKSTLSYPYWVPLNDTSIGTKNWYQKTSETAQKKATLHL